MVWKMLKGLLALLNCRKIPISLIHPQTGRAARGWSSPRSPQLRNRPGVEAWVARVPAPPWSP